MTWEIAHTESFPRELGTAPRSVWNAYKGWVQTVLRTAPDISDPPKVRKLVGYKVLWRLRISDAYRLIYAVDPKRKLVTCLMLGNRKDVYDRLGADEHGRPGIRIVAEAPELLEQSPNDAEIGTARHELAAIAAAKSDTPPELLPQVLDSEVLVTWGVAPSDASSLHGVRTTDALLTAPVADHVKERVLEALYPRTIEEVRQLPVRISGSGNEVLEAAEGARDLRDFLLALDDEQEAYVQRFRIDEPTGPWLLKGAPGSGKSTVALYCAAALLQAADAQKEPLRILFTTYTKSLTRASELLLETIRQSGLRGTIEVRTAHSMAWNTLGPEWRQRSAVSDEEWRAYFTEALTQLLTEEPQFPFVADDEAFIKAEIEWVVLGQALQDLSSYVAADRTGRGRRLTESQRAAVWRLWERIRATLRRNNKCLWEEFIVAARDQAQPTFDYVFVDEAQDLKPVAIRFCLGLLKQRENIFLAADSNQSIYGAGMSWSRVADELKFQGRSRILRKNYRSTKEIWAAVSQLASSTDEHADIETLEGDPVSSGALPVLCWYQSPDADTIGRLERYLTEVVGAERVSRDSVAVLCERSVTCRSVARSLSLKWNAMAMNSQQVDLKHPGVKVMTMHAAKGLQFPIVAVMSVGRPSLSAQADDAEAELAKARRLLFVACTRAARRLIVFAKSYAPSPFLENATDDFWEIESLP